MPISEENGIFTIENAKFRRSVRVSQGGISTVSIFNKMTQREYLKRGDCAEFSFMLNQCMVTSCAQQTVHVLDGNLHEHTAVLVPDGYETFQKEDGREVLQLHFNISQTEVFLSVNYEIWPDICGCRKWIEVTNHGQGLLHLSKFTIELVNVCAGDYTDQEYYRGSNLIRCATAFSCCCTEDIIQVHDARLKEGAFFGLEIPLPLCFFMVYPRWPSGISCGYTQSYGEFNKYLKCGETFKSDAVLMMLYQGEHDEARVCNEFREMIRRTLPALSVDMGVMYCTWLPFLKNIHAEQIENLAQKAATLGFGTLVVDDGWFTQDNWETDYRKFPNGINALSQMIKSHGLRFGLWTNIGTDYGALGSRPEDNCIAPIGSSKSWGSTEYKCRCKASAHREFSANQLKKMAMDFGVDYFKLDFSHIVSPYGLIPPGCNAETHKYHRNMGDATYEQYGSLREMRLSVKKGFPDILLDFSFECFGTERPGIAALQYSELHHASNFNTESAFDNARQIRIALYQYAMVLPMERILGSLICLNGDTTDTENILTALICAPLVAGDIQKMQGEQQSAVAKIIHTYNRLCSSGNKLTNFATLNGTFTSFNQWDGYARYSNEGNGYICLFMNESKDRSVRVTITDIPFARSILFSEIITGEIIGCYSGYEISHGVYVETNGKKCLGILMTPDEPKKE